MRECEVFHMDFKTKKIENDGKGVAKFHDWGVDFEEFDSGPASFSVAIVERENGKIETVCPSMIRFIN